MVGEGCRLRLRVRLQRGNEECATGIVNGT